MPPPPPAELAVGPAGLHGATTPVSEDHDERFGVPTLEELGEFGVGYFCLARSRRAVLRASESESCENTLGESTTRPAFTPWVSSLASVFCHLREPPA